MAIHPSGTFAYKAEFVQEGFRASDIVLHGTDLNGGDLARLVGHKPMIRFWNDRLILVANDSDRSNSLTRLFSVPFGDVVSLVAQPGDKLYVVRTYSGGVGLSLLRKEELILAIGAITAVPLGNHVRVKPATETELEFNLRGEQITLQERASLTAGDYYIYIERGQKPGEPGIDEYVSMCPANDTKMKVAAMRSVILLANGESRLVDWDGNWAVVE